jgi:alpha-tubulin suppressor-like RCC1 family protein
MRATLVLLLVVGCTKNFGPYFCASDSQCVADGVVGVCEPVGRCSFPDSECTSGRRFGTHSGAGFAELCVEALLPAVDAGLPDTLPLDAAVDAPCETLAALQSVSAGGNHTCALAGEELWCWGDNALGQVGDGTQTSRPSPVALAAPEDVSGFSVGDAHTCARTGARTLSCWGNNDKGQIGIDALGDPVLHPALVPLGDVVRVSAGGQHTCALTSPGGLWCWGNNAHGQIGDSTTANVRLLPVELEGVTSIDVAAGFDHTCALTSEHRVLCWGQNVHGELGVGELGGGDRAVPVPVTVDATLVDLSAGDGFMCGLSDHGTVFCWGRNDRGQLGAGVAGADRPLAGRVVDLDGAVSITAGDAHSCARRFDDTVWCWGANDAGQVDATRAEDQARPVPLPIGLPVRGLAVGKRHTCARLQGGRTALCWGDNSKGQFGNGGPKSGRLPPTRSVCEP